MERNVILRALVEQDIPHLKEFPPAEWNFDLEGFLYRVKGKEGFSAIILEDSTEGVVGFGHLIANGGVAWLGNIIVRADLRGRGYGTEITRRLINMCKVIGMKEIYLIATSQGEPLYSRLGFSHECFYHCYRGKPGSHPEVADDPAVMPLTAHNENDVAALDLLATGEKRIDFLTDHLLSGYGYINGGKLKGYFLPTWDNGPVIASDSRAGIALLDFKLKYFDLPSVVPESNTEAIRYLESGSYTFKWKLPRMAYSGNGTWRPDMIYSRAAGYCG